MPTKLIEKCKRCHGTGYFYHAQAGGILLACPKCNGTKVVTVTLNDLKQPDLDGVDDGA